MNSGIQVNKTSSCTARILGAGIAAALFAVAPLPGSSAFAQPRHEGREYERFHSPHWVLDERYHHNHYYPSLGYSVSLLPAGNVAVTFRGGRYFFHAGVWFRPAGPGFVVVRPPVGIVVPVLPPDRTIVWVAGVPYYYANDAYYVSQPGGYAVAEPPLQAAVAPTQTPPPPAPAPQPAPVPSTSGPSASGMWYYCESAKAYYPYVSECREGWRSVPAAPPQMR
jgi:hypothetical protein